KGRGTGADSHESSPPGRADLPRRRGYDQRLGGAAGGVPRGPPERRRPARDRARARTGPAQRRDGSRRPGARGARAEWRPARAIPGRQDRTFRLLRGPGDETVRGEGESRHGRPIVAEASRHGRAMIRIQGLHKRFGVDVSALSEINLEIRRGEFVFVTGASGAGKSSLLRLLLRQDRPTEGRILIGDRNVGELPDRKIPELRRFMGVVFQDFKLIQRKTALENVAYVLNVAGLPRGEQ